MAFDKVLCALKTKRGKGNWGHAGRPGEIGGSAASKITAFSTSKDADSWAEKNMTIEGLESSEYRTLVTYKAGMSRVINAKLRGLKTVDGQPVKIITDDQLNNVTEKLDSIFQKSKMPESAVAYRYLGSGTTIDFHRLKEGDSFSDSGYASTTLVKARAKGITKGKALLKVEIPKDFPAIFMEPYRNETYVKKSESEILLPRNINFTIKQINNKTNPPTITVGCSLKEGDFR